MKRQERDADESFRKKYPPVFAELTQLVKNSPRTAGDCYAMGMAINQLRGKGSNYGQSLIPGLVEELKEEGCDVNPTLLFRAVKFVKIYPPKTSKRKQNTMLDRLERLGWSKVMLLLKVKEGNDRRRIQGRAEQWSLRELQQQVQQLTRIRPARCGRAIPDLEPAAALLKLNSLTSSWLNWNTKQWSKRGGLASEVEEHFDRGDVLALFTDLKVTAAKLGELAVAAKKLRKQLRSTSRKMAYVLKPPTKFDPLL